MSVRSGPLLNWERLDAPVLWTMGAVLAALVAGTILVRLRRRARPGRGADELWLRARSWWVMTGLFFGAVVLSRTAAIVFFAFVSFLALKEFLSLIPSRRADRRVMFWAYLAIPAQYVFVHLPWYGMFVVFIPVYMFLLLPLRAVLIGETRDFLRSAGTIHWGLMTCVFSLSHAAFLLVLPETRGVPAPEGVAGAHGPAAATAASGAGLLLFLVLMTEVNDVAQFCWGKTLGRRRIVPAVSPNKTWGGFLGGLVTTTALATLIGPWLTPMPLEASAAAGFLIGTAGFVGDVTISAIKRDLGIKDTGTLIPGHGGILDRVDSLTYTAPLLFHFVRYLHY